MQDMTAWDDEFEPSDFVGTLTKLDQLEDGEYHFEIVSATQKQPRGKTLIECSVKVLTPGKYQGQVYEWSHWLNKADDAKRLGGVLKKLGFDADDWKKQNGRPFSGEFPKALRLLPGLRFAGKKTSSDKFDQTEPTKVVGKWHNLYANGRVEDGKPSKFGAAELNEVAPQPYEDDPFADK